MRSAAVCFAFALFAAPQVAVAGTQGADAAPKAEAPLIFNQAQYDLASGSRPGEPVALTVSRGKLTRASQAWPEFAGEQFRHGAVQDFEGPSWDYRMSQQGPLFEVAALGGGTLDTRYLAHVAMNWRF